MSHESSEDTRSRVVIDSEGKNMHQFFVDIVINQNVYYTCMTGAMSKDKETGYVTI